MVSLRDDLSTLVPVKTVIKSLQEYHALLIQKAEEDTALLDNSVWRSKKDETESWIAFFKHMEDDDYFKVRLSPADFLFFGIKE